jgi:NitT/TauT family transport system permease protein
MTLKHQQTAVVLFTGIIVLVLWQGLPHFLGADTLLFPPPSDVLRTLWQLLSHGSLPGAALVTFGEVFTAWIISVPIGIACGLVLAMPGRLSGVLEPFFRIFLSLPKSVFLPLFILSLGLGFWQKTLFGVFQAVFYIALSTTAATFSVSDHLLLMARSQGATRTQMCRFVFIPSMLPYVFDGCRVALSFIVTGVIFAEIYASQSGIGYLIGDWAQGMEIVQVCAALWFVAAICIFLNESMRLIERRFSAWRNR